uniref:Yes1 associated transcriptional regulator n=1 Tax=Neogobius melanostomus TaxID=47308 RepID=A0A8C6T633_9GOBI
MDAHYGAPPAGRQIVVFDDDSQTELEALFNAVMNPSKAQRQPASVPMKDRKLPKSFFTQPDPRGHSRQASSDGGVSSVLQPRHVRAHSSPAILPPQADVTTAPIIPDDMPLPHGWEMAKTSTGQRYFLNHVDKTTTWHDPRLAQVQSAAAQHPLSTAGPPAHTHTLSPLPEGWEQAVTGDGEVYYIDHINKATSWVNPCLGSPLFMQTIVFTAKINPALLNLAMQQRQENERLRCKQQAASQSLNFLCTCALYRAHSRNESTDSGLSVSSLPRTTDHMLSPVDHMDTGNATATLHTQGPQLIPESDSGESSSLPLQESMPVLPMSEGEELMPDLLMDMETVLSGSHMDRDSLLTWL